MPALAEPLEVRGSFRLICAGGLEPLDGPLEARRADLD